MPVPTIADADGDGTLDIVVSLKGGELGIHWLPDDDNGPGHVLMTGPVAESFRGSFDVRHYLS